MSANNPLDYETPRRNEPPSSGADPRVAALIFLIPTVVVVLAFLVWFVWLVWDFPSGLRLN
jgi:hypothetical protein